MYPNVHAPVGTVCVPSQLLPPVFSCHYFTSMQRTARMSVLQLRGESWRSLSGSELTNMDTFHLMEQTASSRYVRISLPSLAQDTAGLCPQSTSNSSKESRSCLIQYTRAAQASHLTLTTEAALTSLLPHHS